jgi:hypothetical protein
VRSAHQVGQQAQQHWQQGAPRPARQPSGGDRKSERQPERDAAKYECQLIDHGSHDASSTAARSCRILQDSGISNKRQGIAMKRRDSAEAAT